MGRQEKPEGRGGVVTGTLYCRRCSGDKMVIRFKTKYMKANCGECGSYVWEIDKLKALKEGRFIKGVVKQA